MKTHLPQAVERYLATRRSFGFTLVREGIELHSLVRYAKKTGHTGPLTAALVIAWAQQPRAASRLYWAARLNIGRRFAQFWSAYDPRTQIPPGDLFGPASRRRAVHVYSRQEITPSCKPPPPWARTTPCAAGRLARSWGCWRAPVYASGRPWGWPSRTSIGTLAS